MSQQDAPCLDETGSEIIEGVYKVRSRLTGEVTEMAVSNEPGYGLCIFCPDCDPQPRGCFIPVTETAIAFQEYVRPLGFLAWWKWRFGWAC